MELIPESNSEAGLAPLERPLDRLGQKLYLEREELGQGAPKRQRI
jgi:hypothetical protein